MPEEAKPEGTIYVIECSNCFSLVPESGMAAHYLSIHEDIAGTWTDKRAWRNAYFIKALPANKPDWLKERKAT